MGRGFFFFFSALFGSVLLNVNAQVPTASAEETPSPSEEAVPNVDVEIVPSKRWKTSRRSLMQIKNNLKNFIRDEIKRAEHAFFLQENAMKSPSTGGISVRKNTNPYSDLTNIPMQSPASFQLTHPRFKQSPPETRFQQVAEHISPDRVIEESADGVQLLQDIFQRNQLGAFLDSSQGTNPTQYLEALAQVVDNKEKDPTSGVNKFKSAPAVEENEKTEVQEPENLFKSNGPVEF